MSLNSSNNIGAQYWSDLKTIAPMDPKISPVQKCPNCGKYYLEYKQEPIKGDKESWETGELSYWEWKEAYMQFCTELGNSISPQDMLNVQGWLLQAYNDYFYRGKVMSTPSVEEQEFIANIIKELIETIDWGETMDALFPGGVSFDPPEREKQVWSSRLNPIIKAELYREIGDFQKCADLIKSFNRKQMHSFDAHLCYSIKEHMKQGRQAVFKFYDEQEDEVDYSPKKDEQSTQNNNDVDAFPTMYKCPNCGQFSPGPDKCIHCGADLFTETNYKKCPNGHYYDEKLSACPYCDNQSPYIMCSNGHYYPIELDSCPFCKSNSTLLRCHNCGWENHIGSKMCEKCNTPLLQSQLEEISHEPPSMPPTESAMCYCSFPDDWHDNNSVEIKDDNSAVKINDEKIKAAQKRGAKIRRITYGRNAANDIVINDCTVSSFHMELRKHYDGRITLRDKCSTHGTFINGQDVGVVEVELHHGDVVKIGDVTVSWEDYFTNEQNP